MKLKKSLGQHLLIDSEILKRIALESGAAQGKLCLEIGPGTGLLTAALLDAGFEVTAIEIDSVMIERLERKFSANPRFHLIQSDILDANLNEIIPESDRPALAVGNLPYYISSPIIFKLLEYTHMFEKITVLVQEEVGKRMAASAGGREYGMLSVFCSLEAECKVLFRVGKESFRPPPKVDSCLVQLIPKPGGTAGIDNRHVFDMVVRGAFEHRRKTCYNSLRISAEKGGGREFFGSCENVAGLLEEAFKSAGVNPRERPEQLDVISLISLSNQINILLKTQTPEED